MKWILDILRFRRQDSRIALDCMVDVQMQDSGDYIGFYTRDISRSGVSLFAPSPAVAERIEADRPVQMKGRLPRPYGPVEWQAELKWHREEEGRILTGWIFKRLVKPSRKVISEYIGAHPEARISSGIEEASRNVSRGSTYLQAEEEQGLGVQVDTEV